MLVAQNIQSRVELANLSWLGNWMISYQNHAPYFGNYQDSLIGSAELTRSDVHMDKWHAMQLFSNIASIDKTGYNFDKTEYLGRNLIQKFLPPINFPRKKAKAYLPQYAPFIKYDPDELFVQINRGELISGSLDGSTVGKKVMGSIFHVINNEYGARAALDAISNFHQIVSRFFLWHGFTIGIKDINLSEGAIVQIKEKTAAMITSATNITEKLNRRELIAPIGTTLDEFYESEQLNALEPGDDFVYPILSDIDFRRNKMVRMVFTGSKGNELNVININGAYGQTSIAGRRPSRHFAWGRTSPYFPRYDTSPESLGFINTSYREGIKPESFAFGAGEGRDGIISNALGTSVSGAQSRLSIKNLESQIVDNMRKTVKNENIIQPIYAESGIDPRRTEKVKFLTALISDAEMEEKYHAKVAMFNKKYHNKQVQDALDKEYAQLLADRRAYRDIYFKIESNNPGQFIMTEEEQMPINPFRIIEDVIYNYVDVIDAKETLDPVVAIKKVDDLCQVIAYAYSNSIQEARRSEIPEYILEATTLLKILIRSYCNTANLAHKKITNSHLDIIVDKIRCVFKNSLIDPGTTVGIIAAQCLSEPMTQYVLDSKHKICACNV